MNYMISVIFRAIPLVMALYCFGYGSFILVTSNVPSKYVAGVVIFGLGFICLALFATAATIIRQLLHTFKPYHAYILPGIGYVSAIIAIVGGIIVYKHYHNEFFFVSGHVVSGVGLVTLCVSTVAVASTRFTLISVNSKIPVDKIPKEAFTALQEKILKWIPIIAAGIAWIWAFVLLGNRSDASHFVAGHVMVGLACICTSLISLVATIARQVRNVYGSFERGKWSMLVFAMGGVAILWGVVLAIFEATPAKASIGYVLIGLGLVCLSISSKVVLLAKIWKHDFPLANRIPIIPVVTALTCLFMSAFLFEESMVSPDYYVPAHVLTGLGAICFTLFSIVSILESGTSSSQS